MQVTCPRCRTLADRTYDLPLFRRTKCPHCGYDLEEVNIKEAAKIIDIAEKEWERELEEEAQRRGEAFWEAQKRFDEKWLTEHAGISSPIWCGPIPKEKIPPEGYWSCLLYTSDATDDLLCVDLGGRRIIKKNKTLKI